MHSKFILVAAFMLLPFCLSAQTESDETDHDLQSRTSVSVDWKISKGLHLEGGYELRTSDNLSRIERNQVIAGLEYSPLKNLTLGAGYYFIGHYNSDKEFMPRHRFYADAMISHKFGSWKVSLKEKLQLTHNSYEFNKFQQTPNLLELKSRVKVAYKGFGHLEPYSFVELRNCFNAPSLSCDYNESTGKYSNYQFKGYKDTYLNRIRGAIGLEWEINKHNALDFSYLADWCSVKDIDTNSEGTKLKSWQWDKSLVSSLCLGYVFSF